MSLLVSIVLAVCLIKIAAVYWLRLHEADLPRARRTLRIWAIQGLGVPTLLWMVLNLGILPGLPPLMPPIELARSGGGPWFSVFLQLTAAALLVLTSSWAGMTFVWLAAILFELTQPEHRREFLGLALVWSVLLLPAALLVLYFLGWLAIGAALMVWLVPITHVVLPLVGIKKLPPMYSSAIAKMKFGKFNDAEWDVIHELERCESDFDGWMLLAELYAVHFHDLAVAGQTIHDLCEQPDLNASQIAVALHRLADWHLKLGENPVAARRALQEICRRLPGTHVDRMARLRISQLPATREELRKQRAGQPIRLPALSAQLDEPAAAPTPEMSRERAAAMANQWAEKLKQDPDNLPAREEFARVLAERLDKTELALDQMELLLAMPDQPAQKRAEWLATMAAWQTRYCRDLDAATSLLERLVREYPQSPQAFAAQRRLSLMEMERKMRQARAAAATARTPTKPGTTGTQAGNQ